MWKLFGPALILLGLVYMVVTWHMGTQHWLAIKTGTCPVEGSCNAGPGPYYGFWSGFGSDLGEYTVAAGLVTNAVAIWRSTTCHRYWWCWRHGRYQLEGSPYKLCAHHHPEDIPTVAQAIEKYNNDKDLVA